MARIHLMTSDVPISRTIDGHQVPYADFSKVTVDGNDNVLRDMNTGIVSIELPVDETTIVTNTSHSYAFITAIGGAVIINIRQFELGMHNDLIPNPLPADGAAFVTQGMYLPEDKSVEILLKSNQDKINKIDKASALKTNIMAQSIVFA